MVTECLWDPLSYPAIKKDFRDNTTVELTTLTITQQIEYYLK